VSSAIALVNYYTPPTRAEIVADLRRYAPGLEVYQPADEWLRIEFGGRDYWIPPDLEGDLVPHPVLLEKGEDGEDVPKMVPANGRLRIKDAYGYHRDRRGRATGIGLLEGMDAGSWVSYALENYGHRGLVWLKGDDPARDQKAQEAGRKLWYRYRKTWAEQEREARAAFIRNWEAIPGNKGRVPPPPTSQQIKAQEFLDAQRESGRTGAEFICPSGCWEGSDFKKFQRHMRAAHGKDVADPKFDEDTTRRRAQPLTPEDVAALEREWTDEERAAYEAARAGAAGVGLTPNLSAERPQKGRRRNSNQATSQGAK
jgi:hypothetical protein